MIPGLRTRFLPPLMLALLALLFGYRLAFSDLILARGDAFSYFYPYWDARDAALSAGQLPLWAPELFGGVPLLANTQLGTLYPPNWLTVSLPAPDAVRVAILLHLAWAGMGAFWLARSALGASRLAALVAGVVYAFGGSVAGHIEQINQLQGLSWTPWLFLLLTLAARARASHWLAPFGLAWALQILSGHTQTVFISGVGLGIYALWLGLPARRDTTPRIRLTPVLIVGAAAALAVVFALPQLIPAQGLIEISNRAGGLNPQQATAFSLEPVMIGRGLLPGYAGRPFSEYLGYIGVIGLALLSLGLLRPDPRRWPWAALVVVGLVFALGRYTPIYWALAELPGFNLFRVPARWLVLAGLGAALLAANGIDALIAGASGRHLRRAAALTLMLTLVLGGMAFLADRAEQPVVSPALPTTGTLLAWGLALALALLLLWPGPTQAMPRRFKAGLLALGLVLELWLAAQALPLADLTDPAVYRDPRFAVTQLQAYAHTQTPPGRFMSISRVLGDPGDRDTLAARWDAMPITPLAREHAFTAVKLGEVAAANLPLTWGLHTIDGFDGGVLPTQYFTAFSSLMLPEDRLRSVDGRLREALADPACRGVCLPDDRWLDLTNTRYLVVDKVYDRVGDGVFFDTAFETPLAPGEQVRYAVGAAGFVVDGLHLLFTCEAANCQAPALAFINADGEAMPLVAEALPPLDDLRRVGYRLPDDATLRPQAVQITALDGLRVVAASLLDSRTGDHLALHPPGWQRIYSADVKIYENLDVMPRAFFVSDARAFPDDWQGTEDALAAMRDPAFDPRRQVVFNTDSPPRGTLPVPFAEAEVTISEYTATRVTIQVETETPGYVVLTDAYAPGWQAEDRPVLRANVMFRAVPVPAGQTTVVLRYDAPSAVTWALPLWAVGILMTLLGAWAGRRPPAAITTTQPSTHPLSQTGHWPRERGSNRSLRG